jgi:hypothetical protein
VYADHNASVDGDNDSEVPVGGAVMSPDLQDQILRENGVYDNLPDLRYVLSPFSFSPIFVKNWMAVV